MVTFLIIISNIVFMSYLSNLANPFVFRKFHLVSLIIGFKIFLAELLMKFYFLLEIIAKYLNVTIMCFLANFLNLQFNIIKNGLYQKRF